MPRSIHLIPLAAAIVALQLPCASLADAYDSTAKIRHAHAMMSGTTNPSRDALINQEAERAVDPLAQGGTTGGTVNPSINGDGQHHGYNGG